MSVLTVSPQIYTRTAGICYLLIILLGIFGQIVVRGSVIEPGDAAATVGNIIASPLLWRWGVVGDIAMHMLDIPLMIILYILLSPVHKTIALMALGFNVIQTAVLAANKLTLIVPMILLGDAQYAAAFTPAQIQAQIALLLDIHNYGFGLGLIFFGFACLGYGYLIAKSRYFPRAVGILMAIAGLCYLINSIVLILAPAIAGYTFTLLGLCLIAELSFCLWLLFKGVSVRQWDAARKNNS